MMIDITSVSLSIAMIMGLLIAPSMWVFAMVDEWLCERKRERKRERGES